VEQKFGFKYVILVHLDIKSAYVETRVIFVVNIGSSPRRIVSEISRDTKFYRGKDYRLLQFKKS
jgi:hypothetical protein